MLTCPSPVTRKSPFLITTFLSLKNLSRPSEFSVLCQHEVPLGAGSSPRPGLRPPRPSATRDFVLGEGCGFPPVLAAGLLCSPLPQDVCLPLDLLLSARRSACRAQSQSSPSVNPPLKSLVMSQVLFCLLLSLQPFQHKNYVYTVSVNLNSSTNAKSNLFFLFSSTIRDTYKKQIQILSDNLERENQRW